jgi:predicted ABC-type ATPase
MNDIREQESPKLLIIAGPNGSGKTSVTGKILTHEWVTSCEYINPDLIARDLFGDWNSPESVMQAARHAPLHAWSALIFNKLSRAKD